MSDPISASEHLEAPEVHIDNNYDTGNDYNTSNSYIKMFFRILILVLLCVATPDAGIIKMPNSTTEQAVVHNVQRETKSSSLQASPNVYSNETTDVGQPNPIDARASPQAIGKTLLDAILDHHGNSSEEDESSEDLRHPHTTHRPLVKRQIFEPLADARKVHCNSDHDDSNSDESDESSEHC